MRRMSLAIITAVLLAIAGWHTAGSAQTGATRLLPVEGADYVISMAVARQPQPQGAGTVVTVRYSLAKGDGVIAYEGKVRDKATSDQDDVLRRLMQRATDDIAEIFVTGKIPTTPHRSQTAGAQR
jgi:hypothetical protein